jgi:hypothetical protein
MLSRSEVSRRGFQAGATQVKAGGDCKTMNCGIKLCGAAAPPINKRSWANFPQRKLAQKEYQPQPAKKYRIRPNNLSGTTIGATQLLFPFAEVWK